MKLPSSIVLMKLESLWPDCCWSTSTWTWSQMIDFSEEMTTCKSSQNSTGVADKTATASALANN